MHSHRNRYSGVGITSLLAGPIFISAFAVAMLAESIEPTDVDITDLGPLPALFIFSVVFGSVVAFMANLIGTAAMLWADDHLGDAGLPIVWMLVGGLLAGAGSAFLFPTLESATIAFGLTGAASAFICWRGAHPT